MTPVPLHGTYSGVGPLESPPELSVFVNCPFDADYSALFDAIVFATICCGFFPRSALESGSTCAPRMDRITRALLSSRYSIHDLSRCRGEGADNFARFNMPLELGIAMGQHFLDNARHDWLLLVSRGHAYKRFVSDIAGYDPKEHDGTEETIVPSVMSWLASRPHAIRTATPRAVLASLPTFVAERRRLDSEWHDQVPWGRLVSSAIAVAQDCQLVARAS